MEEFYALLIRPEDGETWGNVPWMDEAWIAKNTIDEEVPSWLVASSASVIRTTSDCCCG
jgi:hypothetical protein